MRNFYLSMSARKKALTEDELAYFVENLDEIESEEDSDHSKPYGSDDSVQDRNFSPSSGSEESESDSSDDDNEDIQIPNAAADTEDNQQLPNGNIWWTTVNNNFVPRKTIPPTVKPIIQCGLNRSSTELDCFLKVFPKSLFLYIAHCTNQRLEILEKSTKKKV
ncbi:uncharacterized protein [Leptinotarsa decemlineata]|uniref:uncharacterized protein n=1 Tax=Leptinotarsa decemlineata TaxID=7539 RepID=UPI003D30AE48